MRFLPIVAVLFFVAAVPPTIAQVPQMDIHVAPFRQSGAEVAIGESENVTRHDGYDNQPFFSPDGKWFLYASMDSSGQTDVFHYEFESGTSRRVTATPESEYSPTVLPGGDGFSTVRVELDGTQRLWRFDRDGANPALVIAGVDSVGYHVWVDGHRLALFIVGEPHSLRLVDTDAGSEEVIALDIGRALHRIPVTGEVSFMRRVADEKWEFFALDADSRAVRGICPALEGSQDCAWTPEGTLLMASQLAIYALDPGGDARWRMVREFSREDGGSITRIAVSPAGDRVALVITP